MIRLPLCFSHLREDFRQLHAGAVKRDQRGPRRRLRRHLLQLLPNAAQPLLHLRGRVLRRLGQQLQDLRPLGDELLFRLVAVVLLPGVELADQRADLCFEGLAIGRRRLAPIAAPINTKEIIMAFSPGSTRPIPLLYSFSRRTTIPAGDAAKGVLDFY